MKPEFVCDNCGEFLKDKMEEEEESCYVLPDNIDGFSSMTHHNCPNHVVLCESCEEEAREELKENEMWSDLEMWDMLGEVKDFYDDYPKLEEYVTKLSKENKK